jgi:hypothetical protein
MFLARRLPCRVDHPQRSRLRYLGCREDGGFYLSPAPTPGNVALIFVALATWLMVPYRIS